MDLILYNGKIITMDSTYPTAEAIAVLDGKIIEVGSNAHIIALKDDTTNIIDLKGKLLLPGFNDSHMHLLNYGISLQLVDLEVAHSIDDLIKITSDFIYKNNLPEEKWIRGMRFNHHVFKEKRLPTRYDLDQISTAHPIILSRVCGHVIIANSKALEIAGVDRNSQQVAGGHFDLDNNGEPLGIFRENAIDLIYKHIPNPEIRDIKNYITTATNRMLKFGITSVQSDDLIVYPNTYDKILQAFFQLEQEGNLPVRVYEQCNFKNSTSLKEFYEKGYYTGYGSEFFKIGPLKLLADGSLGARTAYLKEPYSDDLNTLGIPVFTQDELNDLVSTANKENMPVAIHAIGDKAIDMAITSIEAASKKYPNVKLRNSIIHCQITDNELLDKFKRFDIIAHVQPLFVSTDLHFVEERIGKKRAKTSYNWKSLLDRKVNVAFGSDAPVESPNVFHGIYAAVSRMDLNGYPCEGWLPEQRISLEQALYGYTIGSAYASHEENQKGSITKGKYADFIILENIFAMDIEKVKDLEVEMTFVNGKMVFKHI